MPAVSQQQQKIMGLALSVKRGETPESEVSDDVLKIVNSMSQSELEKYAGTEHDGLPQKVEQKLRETIREIIAMNETEYVESKHAQGPYVGFVVVGNGRKKKIREFDTGRGAQVWLTKNAQKFFDKGFKRVGTTRKSDWDNDPFVIKESVNESNISESYRVVAKNKSGEVFKSGIFDKKKATDLYYKMAKSKKYTSIDIVKESVNEAKSYSNKFASWFTSTVLNTVKHPTYGKHQLTADQIQKSPADYKDKLFKAIEKAIKNGDISSADIKKNESVKESSNPKQPVISKANWDRAHKDYKSIRNGQHYMMYLDKKTGGTIYGPVTIKESVKESIGTLIPKVGTINDFELKNLLLKNKTVLDILSDNEYKFLKSDKTDVIQHQSKPFNTIVTDGKLEFEMDLKTRKVIKPLTKARREILNYYSTNKSRNEYVNSLKEVTTLVKTKDGKLHKYPNFKKPDVINFLIKRGMNQVATEKELRTNFDFYIVESVNESTSAFGEHHFTHVKEAKITVTSIDTLPNIQTLVDRGKVTYRGLGMGKISNDFRNIAGEMGTRIKVGGKEYFITKSDFDKLGGIKKIKFSAPYRRESVKEAKQSDALLVADQLVNGVDEGHLDKREFISHLSKETKFGKNELGKVFDAWVKMDFREKDDLGFSNKEMLKWLKKFGINESVKENKIHIDNRMVDQIKQSVKMGYDTIVVGKITPTKRGVALVNDKYQVRGTYPLELKDAIEQIVKSVK
jgi:hypothetical protein